MLHKQQCRKWNTRELIVNVLPTETGRRVTPHLVVSASCPNAVQCGIVISHFTYKQGFYDTDGISDLRFFYISSKSTSELPKMQIHHINTHSANRKILALLFLSLKKRQSVLSISPYTYDLFHKVWILVELFLCYHKYKFLVCMLWSGTWQKLVWHKRANYPRSNEKTWMRMGIKTNSISLRK